MKLILSVDAINPPLTGIGRYAFELASRLRSHPSLESLKFYRNGRWVADLSALLQPPVAYSSEKRRRKIRAPAWYRNWRAIHAFRGCVFHAPNYFVPVGADLAVATVHDLSVLKYPETHPVSRLRHFDKELMSSLARASHLITPSHAIRQEVVTQFNWPPDRITAVHNGVSASFRPQQPEELLMSGLSRYGLSAGGYALCVSTLEPRKNIHALLEAYRRVPKALRARYPLVLVGHKGWLSEALLGAIDRAQAEGWVRYLGFFPESDLPALYAGAMAFMYPSHYEGFGLPVLEAMASGVPVLTSNGSSLPEISGGAALLVDPSDADALCNGVKQVLLDDEWRTSARSKGLEVASRFSWERCVEQTVAVYMQVSNVPNGVNFRA